MTNHLNSFINSNNNHVSYMDNFIIIYTEHVNDNFNDVMIEYDHEDGRLFIDEHFINDFISWFPVGVESAEDFIKDWFEETFNVKVEYTQL